MVEVAQDVVGRGDEQRGTVPRLPFIFVHQDLWFSAQHKFPHGCPSPRQEGEVFYFLVYNMMYYDCCKFCGYFFNEKMDQWNLKQTTLASPVLTTARAAVPVARKSSACWEWLQIWENKKEASRCYQCHRGRSTEVNSEICKMFRWAKFSPAINTNQEMMDKTY